jgi:hypothetical protein
MGKKRHSLGSKLHHKKNKNKRKKKGGKKWKKNSVEIDKFELGIDEICKQLPDISLNPVCGSSTEKFLKSCRLSESAIDPVFKRKKEKELLRKRRRQLLKKDGKKFLCKFSEPDYESNLPKKVEKNLCHLLESLSCKQEASQPEPEKEAETPKRGFIYTEEVPV